MTLPPGWRVAPLGEVADTALGKMLDRGKIRGLPQVPYLRNVNVQWGRIDVDDVLTMELADDQRERFGVRPGDLLVCEGGEIGRAAVWCGGETYLGYQKALHRVRGRGQVGPMYLRYLFEHYSVSGQLRERATGSTILHLPQRNLRGLSVPVPPLSEQRRIVEILEDRLSRVDAAQQSCRLAMKRCQALVAARITEQLEVVGGKPLSLGQVTQSQRNGIFVSRASRTPNGVPILRIGAVRPRSLDLTDLRYSRLSEAELTRDDSLLSPGDLLFTRYNGNPSYVGACAVVPPTLGASTFPDKLIRVRVEGSLAIPGFVSLAVSSGTGRRQVQERVKTTAGQAGIAGRDLKTVIVKVPSLPDQARALQAVEGIEVDAARLQGVLSSTAARGASIRRSLLAAAFSGRLTGARDVSEVVEEMAGV